MRPLTCNCHVSLTISFHFNKTGARPPQRLINSLSFTTLSALSLRLALKLRLLVSMSVCSGDDMNPKDDVRGGMGQPGKSNAF